MRLKNLPVLPRSLPMGPPIRGEMNGRFLKKEVGTKGRENSSSLELRSRGWLRGFDRACRKPPLSQGDISHMACHLSGIFPGGYNAVHV